jgi:surfactin synthase thioesterase subunit
MSAWRSPSAQRRAGDERFGLVEFTPSCACDKIAARPCPITALGGQGDPLASPEQLRVWGELTSGRFDHHTFPGDHFYLRPSEARVLALVDRDLSYGAVQPTRLSV